MSHGGMAEWRGNGLQSRVHGFDSRFHLNMKIQSIFMNKRV